MNIFVGNLPFSSTEEDAKELFESFGSVASVRIIMEKKGTKSRGFGFVEMPDERQGQTAIAALNGKEFMGRPLSVSPARPKPEAERDKCEAKKIRSEIRAGGQEYHREEKGRKDAWYNPVFDKKIGRYKRGRRSQSFMKRRAASGIVQEASLKRENRENPMRWRKKYEQTKTWEKIQGGPKPWKKADGEYKPLSKAEDKPKSWRRSAGEAKPWRKTSKRPRPHQSLVQSRRKPGGYTR